MEFIFEDIIYKYEDSNIYYKSDYGCFYHLCPVLEDLDKVLDTFDVNQRITILEAIVNSCLAGYCDGKKAKVQEFKRVFDLA